LEPSIHRSAPRRGKGDNQEQRNWVKIRRNLGKGTEAQW
jgi:hypothetical protein